MHSFGRASDGSVELLMHVFLPISYMLSLAKLVIVELPSICSLDAFILLWKRQNDMKARVEHLPYDNFTLPDYVKQESSEVNGLHPLIVHFG